METDIGALPDDAIAKILRLLPPRSLVVARCVCKAWQDIIDTRAPLLPHSVRGIFINYIDHDRPHLFSRPTSLSTFPGIDGLLSFLPNDQNRDWWTIVDHCNGLLCKIYWESRLCVCNPSTQRWMLLPGITEVGRNQATNAYITFDPILSSHCKVFLIPHLPETPAPVYRTAEEIPKRVEPPSTMATQKVQDHDPCRLMEEWPPVAWSLKVFSSATGQWEDKTFVREGQPAGTIHGMRLDSKEPTVRGPRQRYAVYQQGELYVHCQGSFIARFSLSNDMYQVIKTPAKVEDSKPYLGRSKNGVFFGEADEGQLWIWTFNESAAQTEWLLKWQCDLLPHADHAYICVGLTEDGAWIVEEESQDMSDNEQESQDMSDNDEVIETSRKESFEWNSDNDDTFEVKAGSGDEEYYIPSFDILGFHSYKEVVFLAVGFAVMAYHFGSSKAQYLGYARPKSYYFNHTNGIFESFVYTPCLIGELPEDDTDWSSSVSSADDDNC